MMMGVRIKAVLYLLATFSSALAVEGLATNKKANNATQDNQAALDASACPKLPPNTRPPTRLPVDSLNSAPVVQFTAHESETSRRSENGLSSGKKQTVFNLRNLLIDPVTRNQYFVSVQNPVKNTESAKPLANAPAFIVPTQVVRVTPRVSGQVLEILVEEGTQVKAGQVLARLDRTIYDLEYKSALALVERAKAQLEAAEVAVGARQAEIHQAEASVQQAVSQRDSFHRKLERMQQLVKSKAVDERLADEVKGQCLATEAHVQQAEAALKVRHMSSHKETAAAAKADVAYAEVHCRLAKFRLESTEVRAPAAGTILIAKGNIGAFVGPAGSDGRPGDLFEIADLSRLDAVANLPESVAQQIRKGLPCELRIDALPQTVYKGQVWRIAPTVRRTDRTVGVQIKINDLESLHALKPGMYASVRILSKE